MSMTPATLASLNHKRIVVLPDIFIDVLVPLPRWAEARGGMDAIAARGGGNLPVPATTFKLGGNAANLGLALARLGAHVDLIAATDRVGMDLLSRAARDTSLSLDHVRATEQPASTVSLECADGNIMLSHAGPVARFGPESLTPADQEAIQSADAVAVVNWAQNTVGTELLLAVARLLEDTPAFLFFDSADPRHRGTDVATLLAASQAWKRVDAWGMNENELSAFGARPDPDPVVVATDLARRQDVRLDVHTRHWAASVTATDRVRVPAESPPGLRKTGAGDAWNAGNLAGYLIDANDTDRLRLAHQVASAYVTSPDGVPPMARELPPLSTRPQA